jgi:hypothetical protein
MQKTFILKKTLTHLNTNKEFLNEKNDTVISGCENK